MLSALLSFALPASSAFYTLSRKRERERAKNEKDGGYKKEARKKKSNFNQPCTDFIDCAVVKTSEKVIQYVGALLFFLCNCFVQGTRCELASVTWRILALRKQVRVYEDLAVGDWTRSYYICMYIHVSVCIYVCLPHAATQILICQLHRRISYHHTRIFRVITMLSLYSIV